MAQTLRATISGRSERGGRKKGLVTLNRLLFHNGIQLLYYFDVLHNFVCDLECELVHTKSLHIDSHGYVQGTALHRLPQRLTEEQYTKEN